MAGRCTYPWPTLAFVAVVAVAATVTAAPVADVLRLKPSVDESAHATLSADEIYSWTEDGELVYALAGNVRIEQDELRISTHRAVVWATKRRPTAIVVYADSTGGRKVAIAAAANKTPEAERAIVEFTTAAIGKIRGKEYQTSLAHSDLYRSAMAARGKPVAAPKVIAPARPNQPLPGELIGEVQESQFTPPKLPGDPDTPKEATPSLSGTTVLPVPTSDTRTVWISPRTNRPFNAVPIVTAKEKAYVITGGIKLMARFTTGAIKSIEFEADQVVIWQKDGDSTSSFDAMRSDTGDQGANGIELYMTGNVVIRFDTPKDTDKQGQRVDSRTIRADRVYYDVEQHKAIAVGADVEFTRKGYANTGHMVAAELHQLSATEFSAFQTILHASRLPSDPGFKINADQADVYREPRTERRTIFGTPFRNRLTGETVEEDPQILEMTSMTGTAREIPFLYLSSPRTNLNDPLGPFKGINLRQNSMFGIQALLTWDMLDLVGLVPLDGEKWNLLTDYLSERGPAIGTNYALNSQKFLGMEAPFETLVKAYSIYDQGTDRLGGPRENAFQPDHNRWRLLLRHHQRFTLAEREDLTFQGQFALLSDRNFLEQYYTDEYHFDQNQETFAWLKYQSGNAAATFLVEPDVGRYWASETLWGPKVGGYLLGESLFDRFTYHTWGSLAYAQLDPFRQPASEFPQQIDNNLPPPETAVNLGRADWMQKISMPFDLGPTRVVPYGVLDLAYYSSGSGGEPTGRLYGGGGVRTSTPLSRLYADVESELFNVQGLYHKNLFSANYFIAGASMSWAQLPQLDRLNDDAVESAWRDVTPWQPSNTAITTANGLALGLGSYNRYNPRMYAVRRLVDSKPDTLDDIHEVNLAWRQRWQTKRGYPGLEHIVDWLALDLTGSVFPTPSRDNFGTPVGFLEYAFRWAVGDRTTLYSNGWMDPFDFGARYWEIGSLLQRDDQTTFNLLYRAVEPIESRVVAANATYVFSPKYAITAQTAYDLGYSASLTNTLYFTRVGTDVVVTFGVSYNSLIKNLSFTFNVLPNLLASSESPVVVGQQRQGGGQSGGVGGGGVGSRR